MRRSCPGSPKQMQRRFVSLAIITETTSFLRVSEVPCRAVSSGVSGDRPERRDSPGWARRRCSSVAPSGAASSERGSSPRAPPVVKAPQEPGEPQCSEREGRVHAQSGAKYSVGLATRTSQPMQKRPLCRRHTRNGVHCRRANSRAVEQTVEQTRLSYLQGLAGSSILPLSPGATTGGRGVCASPSSVKLRTE